VKSHEAGERGNTQAHLVAAWWAPPHGPDFFASTESSWPKANYIYDPSVYFMTGRWRNENTQYGSEDCEHSRGATAGDALGFPFATINIVSVSPWWRGGSNLYQSLYCASLIRVTWASYHDYDHNCTTHRVDLLLLRWFIRCKLIVVLDVLIDVYDPFMYTLFL
jgi:hypothetical protein